LFLNHIYLNGKISKEEFPFLIPNFRDYAAFVPANGIHLKTQRVYRSGYPDRLKNKDIRQFEILGIQTIIDLRSLSEQSRNPDQLPAKNKVSLPITLDEEVRNRIKPLLLKRNSETIIRKHISEVYSLMPVTIQKQVTDVFSILANENSYPVLIHCRGGKDRTGFVCALLHLALEVDMQAVMNEYLKSNNYLLPKVKRVTNVMRYLSLGLLPVENFIASFAAHEDFINAALNQVMATPGGAWEYFNQAGIDIQVLESVKNNLLDTSETMEFSNAHKHN
jgi:protein-tyrosine phosphatase